MAVTHQYLIFEINIKNIAQIQTLQSTLHPLDGDATVIGNGIGAILAAPDDAAIKYLAPKLGPHAVFSSPSITSKWFGTEDHFPTNVATFDRKSGGWFGWGWLFGDTTHYHWRGVFNYTPDPVATVGAPPNFQRRKWIDGFELPALGEGGTGSAAVSRGASRHVQGMGLALHHQTVLRTHSSTENGDAAVNALWERFYIRVRSVPAAAATLWRARTNFSAASGLAIQMLPSGQLGVNQVDGISTMTLVGTFAPPALDTWARVDLLYSFGQFGLGTPLNTLVVLLNGTTVFTFQDLLNSIQGAGTVHTTSELGGTAANVMAVDIDDWMCATYPAPTDGIDFQNGSAMRLISVTSLAPATTWVGDFRTLLQNPGDVALLGLTSSTAGAPIVANTDGLDVISAEPQAIGVVGIVIAVKATTIQAGATLGISGGAELTGSASGPIVQLGGNWMQFLYRPTPAAQAIKPLTAIQLTLAHGGAGLSTVFTLMAVAEILGTFGPEDTPHVVPVPKVPVHLGVHNAPYARTPWGTLTTPPIQPVYVKTGTYVGNDTGQDLAFPVPIHFFICRPSTAGIGFLWWSSMISAHAGCDEGPTPQHLVQALIDPAFVPAGLDLQQQQTLLRIVGNSAKSNAAGITYTYLAIGDPGMRFVLAGCLTKFKGALDVITRFAHAGFNALAGWFLWEQVSGGVTTGLHYKGPGHAPSSISPLNAAEIANALQFNAVGQLTSKSAFMGANTFDGVPFCLFRMDDLAVGDAGKVVQLVSYVGDGTASRTVALTPVTGKRPMWALVVPHNGVALFRDPSYLTTASAAWNTGNVNAGTGIVGGAIDSISIGITLNANGVVYDIFAIPGDSVAGNGGWSVPGEFMPVSPEPPPGAPTDDGSIGHAEPPNAPILDPAPPPAPLPDPLPPVGPMPTLTDDLVVACEPATRITVNLALSRIGIGKQIANIATDQTREAVAVRLVYNDAIQETLRDFAWPFATRYVQLAVLNAGVRPNSDWLYVYRQPNDCLFERRLVVSRTDVGDPAPSPFLCSSDDTGGLIFANLANAVLEYTARPKCPHTRGEPLFREAAAWKLAELIAPSLSRMTDAVAFCQKGYAEAIAKATLVLRPGIPGEVPAAATVDVSAAAKRANLDVINLALIRIGARTIRNTTTDQSREAQMVRSIFELELLATLRDYPWSFATVYVTPALVAGTVAVPVNGDWQYSFRLPADVVFVRRLVSSLRRAYDRNPPTFKTGRDATGPLLFTDFVTSTLTPIVVEYTNRPEGAVLISDALFRDAFAWRLAWSLAPSLAMIVPETPETVGRGPEDNQMQRIPRTAPASGMQLRQRAADNARQCYYFALGTATRAAANEDQANTDPTDADWITGRG